MRMRRLLAFALAVTMLMGNTVTASATSSTSVSGNNTVQITENEESNVSDEPSEPSGEDASNPDGDGSENVDSSVQEVEEETTTEETTEVPLLLAEEGQTGNISLGMTDQDPYQNMIVYFDTLSEALGEIAKGEHDSYSITLQGDIEYSISCDDLKNIDKFTRMYLKGHDISIEPGKDTSVARINMSIENDSNDKRGVINVANGVTLQIEKNPTENQDRYINGVKINYATEAVNPTLLIGTEGAQETEDTIIRKITFYDVTFSENVNVEVYDQFCLTLTEDTKINSLFVQLDELVNSTNGTSCEFLYVMGDGDFTVNEGKQTEKGNVEFRNNVTFNNIEVNGYMNPLKDFTVLNNCTLAYGSKLSVQGKPAINKLVIKKSEDETAYPCICMDSGTENTLSINEIVAEENDKICIKSYGGFSSGKAIATVGKTISADMFVLENIYSNGYMLEINEEDQLIFQVMPFSVLLNAGQFYAKSLDEIKEYILTDNNNSASISIDLQRDWHINGDFDFSNITDAKISLGLNEHTLTVDENCAFTLQAIRHGNIDVAKDKTITILSPGKGGTGEVGVSQTVFTFDENSTKGGIIIGSEDNPTYVRAEYYEDVDFSNNKFINTNGVDLIVYGHLDYLRSVEAKYLAGNIDQDTFDGEKVTFGSIKVMNRDAGVYMGVPVQASSTDVKGELYVYSLNTEKMVGYGNGFLKIKDSSIIKDISLYPDDTVTSETVFGITLNSVWKKDTEDNVYNKLKEGKIAFSGTMNNNIQGPGIMFEKYDYEIINSYLYAITNQNGFAENDVLAVVKTNDENSELINLFNYKINNCYNSNTPFVVGISETDESGVYELVAEADANSGAGVFGNVIVKVNDRKEYGFYTLKEAKEFIANQSTPNKEFTISLNINVQDVSDELDYRDIDAARVALNLNGHSVSFDGDAVIAIDNMDGRDSKLIAAPSKILTVLPRNNESNKNVDINSLTLVSNATKPATLVLGNKDNYNDTFINLQSVIFSNKWKDIENYGQVCVNIQSGAALNVTGTMLVVNGEGRCAEYDGYGSVNVANLDAKEGNLTVRNLKVTDTAYVSADKCFAVHPDGKAEFKNTVITANEEDPYASFRIELQKQENPYTVTALGKMTFTGTISAEGMNDPIRVVKNINTITFEPAYSDEWQSEEFEDGETVVTATNAAVTAKYFSIDGESRCTKKVGTEIKADSVKLRVYYNDPSWQEGAPGLDASYTSLEDAVANMPTDFDKKVGDYTFVFCDDVTLTKDVVLPSFVTFVNFDTEEDGYVENDEWHGSGRYFVKYLDLNGKKLTTSAQVRMDKGLRVVSDGICGQFIITAVNNYGSVLEISEDVPLVEYGEENSVIEIPLEERASVFDNVLVTAKNGIVSLWVENKTGDEENEEENDNGVYPLWASFDVQGFEVQGGYWCIADKLKTSASASVSNYIKTVNLCLEGNGNDRDENGTIIPDIDADTQLYVSELTINGGYGEIRGRLESENTIMLTKCRLEVTDGGELYANNVTMTESKLTTREAYTKVSGTLNVTKAYAGDAFGDSTIENTNNGELLINTLNMADGTFIINEGARTAVKDVTNIKNFGIGREAHFICDTFTQLPAGKTYLGENAYLWIGKNGTLNKIELDGNAYLGRSKSATVTLNGTFTRGDENQQLHCFVTKDEISNSTLESYKLEDVYQSANFSDEGFGAYVDVPALWDATDTRYSNVETLVDGDNLFNTGITSFPVSYLNIWAWTVPAEDENSEPKWTEENAVYQSGNILLVTGAYIDVLVQSADGYGATYLDSFTTWKEASAYLNTLNNTSATYIVSIAKDLNINQKLELPKNVKGIIISSGKGHKEGENWISEPIEFTYEGDIALNTDTGFDNIVLGANNSTIDTKGKELSLFNVRIHDGALKAIKGTATTNLNIIGSDIKVATKITGIGTILLAQGSSLKVDGGLSVNNLITDETENPNSITVTGDKSVLEVKNTLEMNDVTALYSDGTVKLNNVVSNVEGNNITTKKANAVTIIGSVFAYEGLQTIDVTPVYTGEGENKVLTGYHKVGESENPTETYPIMSNAISLWVKEQAPTAGTVLVTAEKVSPVWFVVAENAGTTESYADLTQKDGKTILCGTNGKANVVLSVVTDGGDVMINTFDALQEAFTEIDKLADVEAEYRIILKADDKALKADGRTVIDYTFPTKAAKLTICSEASVPGGTHTITYSKSLTLNSDVTFENVNLCPSADGGTVALSNYVLELKDTWFTNEDGTENTDKKFKITGSGIGKRSELLISISGEAVSPYVLNGELTNVDYLELTNTDVDIAGKITIGTYSAYQGSSLLGRSAISIIDVNAREGKLLTTPKLTWDKARKSITKIESNLTILGNVDGELDIELFQSDEDGETQPFEYSDYAIYDAAGRIGITFAKAANVNTSSVTLLSAAEGGEIYKKAGALVYKLAEPQVVLEYLTIPDNEGTMVQTNCEIFADAVTEINNLKTKRDYTITFIQTDAEKPVTLTMPKAGFADTLTLCTDADTDVYYEKDITFNSNVVLDNINFVQMAKNKQGTYEESHVVKAAENKYVDPVKVTVDGAYELDINGTVTFNVPVTLSGKSKAVLNLTEGVLWACEESIEANADTYIEGSITKFAKVNADTPITVSGYRTGALNAAVLTYKGTELSATDVIIGENADVIVGRVGQSVDQVNITNLNTAGELTTYGTADIKNVVLSGTTETKVLGQKFNVTGNITSTTKYATLYTVIDKNKKESVLNVTGNVVLENPEDKVAVCVLDEKGEDIILGEEYTDEAGKTKIYSKKLLKAAKADAAAFRADESCVKEDTEYTEASDTGYILKKTGTDIYVCYSDEVKAALYNGGDLYNYYVSFQEAVAAIEALKDTTAEYEIKLLKDFGSETAYEKVNMPTKAASVTISTVDNKAMYYNNDITLGCDTTFEGVNLVPEGTGTKTKGIVVKGFELTLDNISTDGLGKITGDNKTAKVTFITPDNITINGDLTNVVDLVLQNTQTNPIQPTVCVTGKLAVTDLIYVNGQNGKGVKLGTLGKGSSIKNIISESVDATENELYYMNLSINGDITVKNPESKVKLNYEIVGSTAQYDSNHVKLVLNDSCKLVTIPKAALTNVIFFVDDQEVKAAWSGKAVYKLDENYTNDVTVYAEDGTTKLVDCVDLTQAAAYIESVSNKDAAYVIGIPNDVTDTSVTDISAVSKITLPKKDVASKVTIDGNTAAEKISFTGDITANGVVEFKDVKLQNTADYSITAVKNSDDKKAGIVGESELTFNNVENVISTNDKGGKFGYIKSITGEKNATVLTLEDTELLSTAKSDVATLKLASGGAWAALGATTIGTVDNSLQNENSYLGTSLVKGVPQLTITGVVEKPAQMKLYDFTTKEEISGEYNNQPLAIAKTESADKFIASPFATYSDSVFGFSGDVKAYKNKNGYVYNGDISNMDVLLTNENDGTQTYVKTYAEAVQIIDNIGDKTADYCITLRDTTNNEGIIKTALDKNMNAVYGALALPKAGKAASLTIVGEDEKITLKYTGTMKPNCALTFENVTLTEGTTKTVNGEVIFTSSDFITPELGDVNITFGTDVKTLNAAKPADFELTATPNLVFNKVTTKSKGTLDISGHNVYVNGEIKINNLSITSDATLSGKGKITLDEITGSGTLNVNTAYTNQDWKKAVTQFTINGEVSSDVSLAITQYFCENKVYASLGLGYAVDLLFDGASKPAAWQKIITAPKLQIQQDVSSPEVPKQVSFVNYETNDTDYYVLKYDGGVYLTQTRPVIEVKGFKPGTGDTSYVGYFMTWDQAVKEIDKLDHANDKNGNGGWDYTITLSEDIGTIGEPLSTLTLPSKAAKVTIVGEDDYYKDENGEPIKDNQNNPIPDIEGIAIKSTNVSLKTDIEIKVPIVAVKKFGNSYYAIPYTLNAGNYNLVLNEIPNGADFDNMGYYEPQMKLSGSAKGSVEVIPYTNDGNNYVPVITQISNVGTMTFESAETESDVIEYYYDVADGITGVGELILKPGVVLGSKSKDVSVKKLTMGESVAPVGTEYKSNEHWAGLEAKNITVSDTLDMASAWLKAGTSNTGDGKVTLNNVVFEDNHNNIEGKQDAKGTSQIQIKGIVSAKGDNIRAVDSAVNIGLYYNNSTQRYAQLTDGMTLLTAPKAASSWFRPNYAWNDDKGTPENPEDDDYYANMGPEIGEDICTRDEDGNPVFEGEGESKSPVTEWVPTYGTYKSGNFIKYGKLRDVYEFEYTDSDGTWKLNDTAEIVEARVWVGTDEPWDDTANYMEFMTFEEAVKAIDSMGITQKYCIELLRDVEIGNEKGDNKYSALSLPSKASDVTIWGNGCEIRFAGNVTLKCDTTFKDVNLTPLKTVKNGAELTKVNITAGNFVLTWEHASMADETGNSLVGNITGSSKSGELKVMYDTWLFATNITGFKSVVFAGDINGPGNGGIVAGGNVTTKEIRYEENAAGILDTAGNLTTDYVTVEDGAHANLNCYEGKNVKVNGTTLTEGGNKVNTSVAGSGTVKMLIFTESGLQPGSKLLSGKYLNADNWNIYVGTPDGEDVKETAYSSYVNGTDLLLGNEIVTGP